MGLKWFHYWLCKLLDLVTFNSLLLVFSLLSNIDDDLVLALEESAVLCIACIDNMHVYLFLLNHIAICGKL